jgi:hypothetical protein
MHNDQAAIDRITRAQEAHSAALMQLPNVVGTALGVKTVGDKPTDNLALVVLVRRKVPLDQLKPRSASPPRLTACPSTCKRWATSSACERKTSLSPSTCYNPPML